MRVFLAGALGVVGRRLIPLLRAADMEVTGTTRSPVKARELRALGVEPVIVDMFDADAVMQAVTAARPEVIIHQLTDLPKVFDPALMAEARVRNARLRQKATPILLRAAQAAGATRAVVQSICFVYADEKRPHVESDPINSPSVSAMEEVTLNTPGVDGLVLRYGHLWGPGTWTDSPKDPTSLHVEAAAHAALVAITRGAPGVYNIAEDDGTVTIAKAVRELGFNPAFRSTF
jgi:nucleoside-diphosphate-sugar epimerase